MRLIKNDDFVWISKINLIHTTTWMELKGIILSEKRQPHMIRFLWHSWNITVTGMENRMKG